MPLQAHPEELSSILTYKMLKLILSSRIMDYFIHKEIVIISHCTCIYSVWKTLLIIYV